jgi:shikimate kinase
MKTNVALIGFMGVGKTVVGNLVAQRLDKQFVETDSLIVQKAGKSIAKIFKEDGEIAFRDTEIEVIKELAPEEGLVIDCGGGIVLNKINIDRLKQKAIVVWLTASPNTILKRTAADRDERPLLSQNKGIAGIQSMIHLRKPFYEQAADIKVDTSRLSTESVASKIIERLAEFEDFY